MSLHTMEKVSIGVPIPEWVADSNWINNKSEWLEEDKEWLLREKQVHTGYKSSFFRTVRKFNTLASVQNESSQEKNFDSSFQSVLVHSFTIFRGNEKINKLNGLKKKLIQREADASSHIYDGMWTLILIPEDIRKGDILEFSYSYEGENPLYEDHILESFIFATPVTEKQLFFRLITDSEKVELKDHYLNHPISVCQMNLGFQEWTWDISNFESTIFEPMQPLWHEVFSWTQITTFKNWGEVSLWAERLFPKIQDYHPRLSEFVESFKKKFPEKKNLIIEFIRFVQNEIRYLSVGEGVTDYKASSPNETFQRRFGDCKDKTWFLCHLLNLIGVSAFPFLVHTRQKHTIVNLLPSPTAFNHAIVYFELEEQRYWVDVVHSLQGGSLEHLAALDYGYGLLVGNKDEILRPILHSEKKNKTLIQTRFDLKESESSAIMKIETVFFNEDADEFRTNISQINAELLTQQYLEFYNRHYSNVYSNFNVLVEDDLYNNKIFVKEECFIKEFGKKEENNLIYCFYPFSILSCLSIRFDIVRKTPHFFFSKVNIQEELYVKFFSILDVDLVNNCTANDYFEYDEKWIKEDELNYIFIYKFKIFKEFVEPSDLPSIQIALDTLYKKCGIYVSIKNHFLNLPDKSTIPNFSPKNRKMSRWTIFYIIWFIVWIMRALREIVSN